MNNSYKLASEANPDKVFLVNRSELKGRFDPIFYNSDLTKLNNGKYRSSNLGFLTLSFKSGIGAGKQDQTDEINGIIQIRPTNIDNNGFLKFDKNVFIPRNSSIDRIQIDDILFNNTNSQELVGKTAILKEQKDLSYSNHITRIRVNRDLVAPDYLWIILNLYQQNKIFYSICTNWNNQSGVGLDLLKSLQIPLPPLPIQQQIVDLYQEAYKLKQQKEAEAKTLLDSIDGYLLAKLAITLPEKDNSLEKRVFITQFSEVTGMRLDPFYYFISNYKIQGGIYENRKLKDIAILQKGQSITSSDIIEGDYPVIAGGQSSPYKYNVYNHTGKTITVSASGAYSGYVWYHDYPIFASDCIVIKSKNESKISTLFLSEILKLKQQEIYNLQQGAGQPHVYASDLGNLLIPVPEEGYKQNEIAEHIQGIRQRAKQLQEEAKNLLEEAKQQVEQMILGD